MYRVVVSAIAVFLCLTSGSRAEECPVPIALPTLQKIIDSGEGDPVPVIAALRRRGTSGAAIAAYMEYINTLGNLTDEMAERKHRSVAELYLSSASIQEENVLNRYVLALAGFEPDSAEQEQDFLRYVRNFLELNTEYCLFDTDNNVLSSVFYRYYRLLGDSADSKKAAAKYLRKTIAGHWEHSPTDRYIQDMRDFDPTLFEYELSQWQQFFGRTICAPGTGRASCTADIVRLLKAQEQNVRSRYDDTDSLFCNAKLLHEGQIAAVWICGPVGDF